MIAKIIQIPERYLQPLWISDTCSTVRAPGRSPELRSGHLAGPRCTAAFPEPRRRQLSQGRQEALRTFGTGRTVRAHPTDLRSPGADTSPVLDALQLPGSSQPAARSKQPGRSLKPGSRQLAGLGCAAAFRILGARRTARAPGESPEPRSGQLALLDAL